MDGRACACRRCRDGASFAASPLPDILITATPAAPPRPVFILGCPRSGTSVLARMLGRHPDMAIPYESHLYNRIYPLVRQHGEPTGTRGRERFLREILRTDYLRHWSPPPSLPQTMAALDRDDFHGLVGALLAAWASGQGKTRWGEKTPQHALWWRELHAGFPDLQLVHVVRDGRDVALSYRSAHFGPKHVYALAERWVEYLVEAEAAERALGPESFRTVRYEDLLDDPEGELRRLCGFLDLPYDPAMLSYHEDRTRYPTDGRNERNLRLPLLTDNTGKWRTKMSRRELRIFEACAGDALERFGYDRALSEARLSRWEAWSCRYLEHPPRRMLAMARNRQAVRLLLERLRLALLFRLGAFRG